MEIGLQSQIWRNNRRSIILLALFPALLLGLSWGMIFAFRLSRSEDMPFSFEIINELWLISAPFILLVTAVWFLIAWFSHTKMIQSATGARPIDRRENARLYNLLENLCISRGIAIPKLYVIDDTSLNAYASGINPDSYAITVSSGMLEKLDDAELEGVLAHELTHILNRDVRLLIISIIFVGIFSFIAQVLLRGGSRSSNSGKKGGGALILAAMVMALLAWLIATLMRLAISRNREFMADAGAVELTKNGPALASALEKVAADSMIESVSRNDVAQLFIHHPQPANKLLDYLGLAFSTHPPIEDRIAVLKGW